MEYQTLKINKTYGVNQQLITFFVFLTVICVPFATVDIAGFGVLLIFTIPLFFFVALQKLQTGRISVNKPVLLFFLFIAYGTLACFWSPSFSCNYLYQYLKTVALIVCLYANSFSLKEQKTLVLGSVISCIMICFFMLTGNSSIAYVEGRATISVFGASQDPNYIAYAFFFAFTVALDGIFTTRRVITKILCLIAVGVILYCVLLTGSRGAWLSCIAILLVYSFTKYKNKTKMMVSIALLSVAVVYIYPMILQLLPGDLARRFTYEHLMHNKGSNRLDIWIKAWDTLKGSPINILVGYGTGSSVAVVGRATHNYFLQLLIEEGVIGLLLFLSFVIYWLKTLIREKSTISLCVYTACLVMALTLSVNTSYYFWVTFLLCILCRGFNSVNTFWKKYNA